MPKLREFTIDEAYLCDITICKEWNVYTQPGQTPTPEEMVKILKGEGKCSMLSHNDHPEFEKLRNELERLGYIKIERGWSNGDQVIKSFRLNGYIARKGWGFSCASALGNHFKFLRNHPKYDQGYLN